MPTTRRTATPTMMLVSLLALLLALLGGGTAAVAETTTPPDDTACPDDGGSEGTASADCTDDGADEAVDFKDLPPNLPHIEGISWLAEHGITKGCAEGKYCPNKPVTRGQFASFLYEYHRVADDVSEESGEPTVAEQIAALTTQIDALQQEVEALTDRVDAVDGAGGAG